MSVFIFKKTILLLKMPLQKCIIAIWLFRVAMKPGKMDVSGGYSSDALLHAPDSLFDNLAVVFKSFLIHGTVSRPLLACAFLPLLKGGLKDPGKCDSYRAIAGSSQILKLFDNTVLLIWGHLLSTDSLQFRFKLGTSTTQCSWLVNEVSSWYLRAGTPIILCILVTRCVEGIQ